MRAARRFAVTSFATVAALPPLAAATPAAAYEGRAVVSISSVELQEGPQGRSTVELGVTLSTAPGVPVEVTWSTRPGSASAPSDFVAASGTVTVARGLQTARIAVEVEGDDVVEGDEEFVVHLDAAAGADLGRVNGLVTVRDDEETVITVAPGHVTTPEGGRGGEPHVAVPVRLSSPAAGDVAVTWETRSGTAVEGQDFVAASGTLVIAEGEVNGTIPVTVVGDRIAAGSGERYFIVSMTSVAGAVAAPAYSTVLMTDDDPTTSLTTAVGDVAIVEGDAGTGLALLPVVLSKPATSPLTVEWSTSDGTATAPDDYEASSGSLVIAPGAVAGTIDVPVHADTDDGVHEAFTVALSSVSAGTVTDGVGSVTIVDDDPMRLVDVGDVTVTEPDTGAAMAVVPLTTDRPVEVDVGITVRFESGSAGSDDFTWTNHVGYITDGQRTGTVKVPIVGDTTGEAAEAFSVVVITSSTSDRWVVVGDGVGTVTIRESDGGP